MALLFHAGFDHYVTADLIKEWNGSGAGTAFAISASEGRRGSGAAKLTANSIGSMMSRILPSSYSTLIQGCAFNYALNPGGTQPMLAFGDTGLSGALVQVTIAVDANLAVRAYRGTVGGTLLGTSANAVVPISSYFHGAAKVLVSATVGTVDVLINNVSVLSLTGLNTKNTANTTMSQVGPGAISSGSNNNLFDDFYCCDTSGSAPNNTFLGDARVDTLYPNADGTYTAWTPTGGGAHYTQVNANAPQMTTNVSNSVIGDKDSYAFGNLGALTSETIFGVQAVGWAQKSDAGSRNIELMARSSATDAFDAVKSLATAPTFYYYMLELNPNGSVAWTRTAVDAAEFGARTA